MVVLMDLKLASCLFYFASLIVLSFAIILIGLHCIHVGQREEAERQVFSLESSASKMRLQAFQSPISVLCTP